MKNLKIAITGGIGSGKSCVGKILASYRYPVYSCDEINRELLNSKEYADKIESIFPGTTKNGKVLSDKLAKVIFSDKESLLKLNQIAHPLIMRKLMQKMDNESSRLIFAEVPLLFEGGFENCFDKIIVVLREKEQRINALIQRDSLETTEILARMNNQYDYDKFYSENFPQKEKILLLQNNGDLETLKKYVSKLLNLLQV